jgi:hypothetical protein
MQKPVERSSTVVCISIKQATFCRFMEKHALTFIALLCLDLLDGDTVG